MAPRSRIVEENDIPRANVEIVRVVSPAFLKNKKVAAIETVVNKPLKSDPLGKAYLLYIVRFKTSHKKYAVHSTDAHKAFPQNLIEYFESIAIPTEVRWISPASQTFLKNKIISKISSVFKSKLVDEDGKRMLEFVVRLEGSDEEYLVLSNDIEVAVFSPDIPIHHYKNMINTNSAK